MVFMRIIIGADHGGYELKNNLTKWLNSQGHEIKDIGVFSSDSVDYPDISKTVGEEVSNGNYERGILVCGSGVGVNIAVNKIKGIRSTHCHDTVIARLSREHNNTNIITMGGRFIAKELAQEILNVWLTTDFLGGRHQNRIDKISQMEE
jgi:ribose 5-phosphate isomerase B